MKEKKILQEQARNEHTKILDNNKDFYENYINNNFHKKNTKSGFLFNRVLLAISSLVMAVLIGLNIFVILEKKNVENSKQEKQYFQENELNRASSLAELNQSLLKTKIQFSDDFAVTISLIYDSVTGDNLMFLVTASNETSFEELSMSIIVNDEYIFNKNIDNEAKHFNFNGLSGLLSEMSSFEDDIYTFKSKVKIETEEEIIFIDYEQFSFDENSTFINTITGIIRAK